MQIQFQSRHTSIPEAIRLAATDKLARLERYLFGLDRAEVIFLEEPTSRLSERETCEILVQGHGHHFLAKAVGRNPGAALDAAVTKIEHQLQARRSRLIGRSHPRRQAS